MGGTGPTATAPKPIRLTGELVLARWCAAATSLAS
jgi:hypothetical protein